MTNAMVEVGEQKKCPLPSVRTCRVNAHRSKKLLDLFVILPPEDLYEFHVSINRAFDSASLINEASKIVWLKLPEPLSEVFQMAGRRD
jgi:hypothetical protein